ncbi:hypothetical protein [Hydrogenophaga sp.]|uniref:hypothetical protein n=1 Tax=Hydrogenophaga sp. TaxID=1904254 RepID=UPI002603F88A|nr:hypothetical protein [Hydrogenophaga sp.]MCW5655728.1 hypothetical protein [Hydrogenophaga sp.]
MDYTKIQWWDRNSFFRSIATFVVVLIGLLGWVEHIKPPEEKPFERLPMISGIYKCCEAGGRYSASWVGSSQIVCGPTSYWGVIGTPRNDCGLKAALDDERVEVERVFTPLAFGPNILVKRIRSNSNTFYEISDHELHRRWINESRREAFSISTIIFIAIYFFNRIISKNK